MSVCRVDMNWGFNPATNPPAIPIEPAQYVR